MNETDLVILNLLKKQYEGSNSSIDFKTIVKLYSVMIVILSLTLIGFLILDSVEEKPKVVKEEVKEPYCIEMYYGDLYSCDVREGLSYSEAKKLLEERYSSSEYIQYKLKKGK